MPKSEKASSDQENNHRARQTGHRGPFGATFWNNHHSVFPCPVCWWAHLSFTLRIQSWDKAPKRRAYITTVNQPADPSSTQVSVYHGRGTQGPAMINQSGGSSIRKWVCPLESIWEGGNYKFLRNTIIIRFNFLWIFERWASNYAYTLGYTIDMLDWETAYVNLTSFYTAWHARCCCLLSTCPLVSIIAPLFQKATDMNREVFWSGILQKLWLQSVQEGEPEFGSSEAT